jgi:hypothetical protein
VTLTIRDGSDVLTVEAVEKFSGRWLHVECESFDGTYIITASTNLHSLADVRALRDACQAFLDGDRPTGTRAMPVEFKP